MNRLINSIFFVGFIFCSKIHGSMTTLTRDSENYRILKMNSLIRLRDALSGVYDHKNLSNDNMNKDNMRPNDQGYEIVIQLQGRVGFEFNKGLNGYCGTVINEKLRNRPQDFPAQRWNLMSFQEPAAAEFNGPTKNASVLFRSVWLEKIAQIVVYHCYAKLNGDKVFKELHVDHENPFKVDNNWKEYLVDSAFDDEHGRIGSVAVAYRYQRSIVYGTNSDHNAAHLHITLRDNSLAQKTNLCRYEGQRCCLEPIELDFKMDGFGNIIHHPKVVTVYNCRGTCVVEPQTNDTRLLFEKLLNGTKPSFGGKPCCKADGFDVITVVGKTAHPEMLKALTLKGVNASSCSCHQQ